MKGLILKPMISLLLLAGELRQVHFISTLQASVFFLALQTTSPCPPPVETKLPKAGRRWLVQVLINSYSHKTFHLPLSMMTSQCLIFTCGNKLEYKKSASMTTWAMISSDAPHQAEGSSGQAGEIAHRGCWSCTACWTTWGTEGSATNAQTHHHL